MRQYHEPAELRSLLPILHLFPRPPQGTETASEKGPHLTPMPRGAGLVENAVGGHHLQAVVEPYPSPALNPTI